MFEEENNQLKHSIIEVKENEKKITYLKNQLSEEVD